MKRAVTLLILIALATIFLVISVKNTKIWDKTDSGIAKEPPKEVVVTLDKEGFKPKTVGIKIGTAVRWKNESGDRQTVNSDDYPTNQLHKELNFGVFENDSSVVYTFKESGEYGYHNQLNPEQNGKVLVTE